jgi:hypothetical protein
MTDAKAGRIVTVVTDHPACRDRSNLYLISNAMYSLRAAFKLRDAISPETGAAGSEPHSARRIERTIFIHAVVE